MDQQSIHSGSSLVDYTFTLDLPSISPLSPCCYIPPPIVPTPQSNSSLPKNYLYKLSIDRPASGLFFFINMYLYNSMLSRARRGSTSVRIRAAEPRVFRSVRLSGIYLGISIFRVSSHRERCSHLSFSGLARSYMFISVPSPASGSAMFPCIPE